MIGQTTQIINPVAHPATGSFSTNVNLSNGDNDIVHNLGTEKILVHFFKGEDSITLDYSRKAGALDSTITVSVIGAQNDVDVFIIAI